MVEIRGYTRIRGGGVESTAPSDMIGGKDSTEWASLVLPSLRKLEQSSSISQEQYEVVAEHADQVEYEFIAKLSIAFVLLVCLMVWFAWSFWWEKNMRQSLASRRRRGQRMATLERTTRSHSPPPPGGDTSPSSQGTGVGVGHQRDGHAVERIDQQQQQQSHARNQSSGQGTPLKEFSNPMWGKTSNSRDDRCAGVRERSTLTDRGDELGDSSRNATVSPREMRRWRPPR